MIWIAAVIGGLIGAGMGILAEGLTRKRRAGEGAGSYIKPERKPVETVTVRARRDIPEDVWLDKIMSADAKTAQAQLRLSMAQQLAGPAAQHVAIGYVYDQHTRTYKVWGEMRVLPLEGWK